MLQVWVMDNNTAWHLSQLTKEKLKAKSGLEIHNIGELYQQTKDSGKINKSDIKFFEALNFYIKSVDEIFLKALAETYKADEL